MKKLVKNFPKPDTSTPLRRDVGFVWESAESVSSIIKSLRAATFSATKTFLSWNFPTSVIATLHPSTVQLLIFRDIVQRKHHLNY